MLLLNFLAVFLFTYCTLTVSYTIVHQFHGHHDFWFQILLGGGGSVCYYKGATGNMTAKFF